MATVSDTQNYAQSGFMVPSASTNGTLLQGMPARTSGVRIYVPTSGNITFYFASSAVAPTGAPSNTWSYSAGVYDEPLSSTDVIYVTALTGTVLFRWVQR